VPGVLVPGRGWVVLAQRAPGAGEARVVWLGTESAAGVKATVGVVW
jgi:hypothetical protein